jgi:hypothetical protein
MHVDSFSGLAAALPRGRRTSLDVLKALAKDPKVSTWDLSELGWLADCIDSLKGAGLIALHPSVYPWSVYRPTDKGAQAIEDEKGKP